MEKTKQHYLPLSKRTGKLPHTLQNDYLFKVVLQSDKAILHSLLCSLLFLEEDEIVSARITNPIIPGESVDMKTVMLDIKLILNDRSVVNLEMQNLDKGDWPERSLVYLCRTFNSMKKGEASYLSVMPAHHIGILDFTLPHLSKEFYSHFYMMNPKTYEIYSDKLCLSMLNLRHRELATEEEKQYGLDRWARAFLADTWEEFQMLAREDIDFKRVADSVYKVLVDEAQRDACLRYEERKAEEELARQLIKEKDAALQEKDAVIREKDTVIERIKREKDEEIRRKDALIAELMKGQEKIGK